MSDIASRIRRLRETTDLDQRSAADLAGLSQATWSRIESGDRTPKLGEVVGIAAALGCLTSTILDNGEIGERLTTVMRKSVDEVDAESVAEDLQFLLETEADLHAAGFLE
jgi:transcriptional regulator with XRE-family HTH domain